MGGCSAVMCAAGTLSLGAAAGMAVLLLPNEPVIGSTNGLCYRRVGGHIEVGIIGGGSDSAGVPVCYFV